MIDSNVKKRFWSYVDIGSEDQCWPWMKCRSKPCKAHSGGYGFFGIKGKNYLTHRLAYEFIYGEGTVADKVVRHSCDNPSCCNPKHLCLGTQKDNMHDKIQRGRARYLKGDQCSWTKLTEKDIPEIRKLLKQGVYHKVIAKRFNVDTVTITDINIGRSWRHL